MAVATPSVPATGVAVPNATGQYVSAAITGGTVQTIVSTPSPQPSVVAPPVPASTVTATNTNSFPVLVALTGGTTTVIAVNGVTVATTTPASVVVPAGGTIAITYTVAPTWTWSGVFAGASGNPVASPTSVPVPPGGSLTLFYSAAPTMAWTDPGATSYSPGYSASNTGAEFPGYNPYTSLPLTQHSEAGQAGLATGVTN